MAINTDSVSDTLTPSTGAVTVAGILVNKQTITVNTTVPTGFSAQSAGPITINSGVSVTLASGSRWVIL